MLFQWAAVTFSIHTPFKVLFFVKNIGQWNAKSGPKAAYGNFAMRKKNSGSLKKKWKRKGRNGSHFAHTHTHSAKLVVRISIYTCRYIYDTRAETVPVCICPLTKPVPMCIYRNPNTKGKFCAIHTADNIITDGKVRMVRPIVRQLFTVSSAD